VQLGAVDVRQVVAANAFLRVGQQSFGHQLRAEERATDTDVDHVSDRLLGVTAPKTVVDAADQVGDLVQHFVDFRHHVGAVDQELVAHWATQRGVQSRAVFRRVDRFAVVLRLDCVFQTDFIGQVDQQLTGFGGDQVFRIIEEQPAAAEGEFVETLRVFVERLTHAEVLHGVAVIGERLPGGQGGDVMRSAVVRHRCGFPCTWTAFWTLKSQGRIECVRLRRLTPGRADVCALLYLCSVLFLTR
jgi:hypothetical protein